MPLTNTPSIPVVVDCGNGFEGNKENWPGVRGYGVRVGHSWKSKLRNPNALKEPEEEHSRQTALTTRAVNMRLKIEVQT